MSRHPDFKTLESTRPAFDANAGWTVTQTADPAWLPGQGAGAGGKEVGVGGKFKQIDPKKMAPLSIYKMMISAVTPRPIGFCSTLSATGEANLAPFSYFNIVGHNPPMIMVSFTHPMQPKTSEASKPIPKPKDSCANIHATKQFSMNIISEHFVEAANYTSIDAPDSVSEWALSGLTQVPSTHIAPPRVGESGFSMECELEMSHDMFDQDGVMTGTMVLGRVLLFHVREDLIDENLLVDTAKLQPVSRLGGISYGRTTTGYEIPRPVFRVEEGRAAVKSALEKGEVKAAA